MPDFRPILLASTSRYRAERLASLGLAFEQVAPNCDEMPLEGESAHALSQRLASVKAASLVSAYPDRLIIGSDQTASLNHQLRLDKPGTKERAIAQLQACSGKTVVFYTSVALAGSAQACWTVSTEVRFRTLQLDEIKRYIAADQPLDCAGSFKAEGLGISLFESLRSDDPNALIGLPLISLAQQLRQLGYQVP